MRLYLLPIPEAVLCYMCAFVCVCLHDVVYLIEINRVWGMRGFSVFCQRCEISVCVWERVTVNINILPHTQT